MDSNFLQFLITAGASIIPFLWQNMLFAGIVFIIIWLMTILLKKKSPRWQYALWFLVLTRLILPPNFSHPFSSRNLVAKLSIYEKFVHLFDYFRVAQSYHLNQQNEFHGISVAEQPIGLKQNIKVWISESSHRDRIFIGLFLLWLSGASIFLTIYLKKLTKFRSIIKKANHIEDPLIQNTVKEWCAQFHIKRIVRIVSSEEYLSPFTMGMFKPVVYLPKSAMENNHHLESIIAHEICHIKRYDNLWLKLQSLLQIIYFFNPVVWYVNSKINLARECICDTMVLAREKISATNYGNGIMTILKLNLFGAEEINVLPGFGSQRKKLIYRIKNIKGEKIMGKYQTLLIYFTLALLGILVLPMAGHVLKNSTSQEPRNTHLNAAEIDVAHNDAMSEQKKDIVFMLPLKEGRVTARFGNMKDPYKQKIVHHNGIDIAAPKGIDVHAAAEGMVITAISEYQKKYKGPGKHILIRHENGFLTFYSHLNDVLVKKGQQVKADEIIARVGMTGLATGPHLHFEIRKNEKPQNPQKYINFKKLRNVK